MKSSDGLWIDTGPQLQCKSSILNLQLDYDILHKL